MSLASVVSTVGSFLYSNYNYIAIKSENGFNKDVFRKVDIISSLFGLATIKLMEDQGAKIILSGNRLWPKTKMDSAKENPMGKILNANILPEVCLSLSQSIERTQKKASHLDLHFFNIAIPSMNIWYPMSASVEQNKIMREFWLHIRDGIEILEKSYSGESKFDENGVLESPKDEDFPIQQDMKSTFKYWKNKLDQYIKTPVFEGEILINKELSHPQSKKNQLNSQPIKRVEVINENSEVESIKNLWKLSDIAECLKELNTLKNEEDPIQRIAKMDLWNKTLDRKSKEYQKIVEEYLDRIFKPL